MAGSRCRPPPYRLSRIRDVALPWRRLRFRLRHRADGKRASQQATKTNSEQRHSELPGSNYATIRA